MNQGAKVLLGGLALVGIGVLVFTSGEKQAHAESGAPPVPLPPVVPPAQGFPPIPPLGGIIMAPPSGTPSPAMPPIVAPSGPIALPGGGSVDPGTGAVTLPGGSKVQLPPLGSLPSSLPTFPSAPPPTAANAPPVPTQVLPGLIVTPGPAPLPSEPPSSAAEQPTSIPADTLQVVTTMLAQEHSPHWRIIPEPTLKAWQKSRGLTADGSFGTGTALALAREVGTVPIIRAWPKGSYKEGHWLANYTTSLRQLALAASEPRKSQLIAAANREQGQGWGTPETPIGQIITLQDA